MLGKISQLTSVLIRFAGIMSVLFLVSFAFAEGGPTIQVNCDKGQSLNKTLSKLNKNLPTTILLEGTCNEYVTVDGFEGLTIQDHSGAAIQQPSTPPPGNLGVLSVTGSRGVTISGIAVHSLSSAFSGVGVGKGSNQILLQNITTDGSSGVAVYEESQAWLVNVNVTISSGFAAIWVFDKSDVHIVGGMLQKASNLGFNTGLFVGSGHVTMEGMTIRDMQQGISINASGSVDLNNFASLAAGTDVIIDNPSGTNSNGVIVSEGSSLNLGNVNLRINNAGQWWGGTTGGVFVTNNSVLSAGPSLVVTNSVGQGLVVTNNSHATLSGSSITGGQHGGLVVANLSTIDNAFNGSLTVVGGNATDLFCDSNSFITGMANLNMVSTVNCGNVLSGNTSGLP